MDTLELVQNNVNAVNDAVSKVSNTLHTRSNGIPWGVPCVTDDIEMLWHNSYYDGPMTGMLSLWGERCRFEMVDEDENLFRRLFAVIRLTADQLNDETWWHNLFRTHVGTHCDYGRDGRRDLAGVHFGTDCGLYYRLAKAVTKLDYSQNEVIGWFTR